MDDNANGYTSLMRRLQERLMLNFPHAHLATLKIRNLANRPILLSSIQQNHYLEEQIKNAVKCDDFTLCDFLNNISGEEPIDQNISIVRVLVDAQWHDTNVSIYLVEQYLENLKQIDLKGLNTLCLAIGPLSQVELNHENYELLISIFDATIDPIISLCIRNSPEVFGLEG
jgi:uncharacterized protein (UPF0276 family)